MLTSSSVRSDLYIPNGVTTEFAFTFQAASADDIDVEIDAVEIDPSLYSVSLNDDGTGHVTFFTAPIGTELYVVLNPVFTQPTTLRNQGPYFQSTIEGMIDREARKSLWLRDQVMRSIRTAPGTSLNPLPGDMAGQYLAFDVDGQPVGASGTGADSNLRPDLADDTGSSLVAFKSNIAGAIKESLQTVLRRFPVFPEMLAGGGAVTATLVQAISDALSAAGGGRIMLAHDGNYTFDEEIYIRPGVLLQQNGADVTFELEGGDSRGWVLAGDHAHFDGGGGTVSVVSTDPLNDLSTQGIVHSPVSVGALYGQNGTVVAPSSLEGAKCWSIRNVTLASDKVKEERGAAAIAVYGGACNGLIEEIDIPDSTALGYGIAFEWNFLGDLQSQPATPPVAPRDTPKNNMDENKSNFNAGDAYTTHPNNIFVRNVKMGKLTLPASGAQDIGSFGIRISGGYNIIVENVIAASISYQGYVHTVGDMGAEFARGGEAFYDDVNEKPFIGKNVVFKNCTVIDCGEANLARSDSYADNVADAVDDGYTSLLDPLMETNILFENLLGKGSGDADAKEGIRFDSQRGGTIRGGYLTYFQNGIRIDSMVSNVRIDRPSVSFAWEDGIYVGHGTNLPEDIEIIAADVSQCGQDTVGTPNAGGITIANSERVVIRSAKLGKSGEFDPTQRYGIKVLAGAVDTEIHDPYIRSARAVDGIGINVLSGNSYNAFGLLTNPRYETAYLAFTYIGLALIPYARRQFNDGGGTSRVCTDYTAPKALDLEGLVVSIGDRIFYSDAASGEAPGRQAVAAGTMTAGGANLNTLTKTMAALA